MKKIIEKIKSSLLSKKKLNPENPQERKKIIQEAVQRTAKEYGEALKKLGAN